VRRGRAGDEVYAKGVHTLEDSVLKCKHTLIYMPWECCANYTPDSAILIDSSGP
jgi:hypothetical protein